MFDHPEDTPILTLSSDESWQLLEGVRHGRLVTVVAGRVDIFPVNVVADDRTLVFRTGGGVQAGRGHHQRRRRVRSRWHPRRGGMVCGGARFRPGAAHRCRADRSA
ncbi:pyridoxamine 5'-phosphate oxidase family protein [Nesterenkonia aethiopica]|uniref:pyridoxamine 5'-phosphate oxidase family protein n=1 Tax=Nesterenkonia aethiopica TaxID=269144 RepID=UPI0031DADE2E